MREIVDKNQCYGCGACEQVCPVGCISMQPDSRGFLYPIIDEEKCINCGKCQKHCIARQGESDDSLEQVCYIGVHKNEDIWMNSASGGAFSAIVEALNCENLIVFGAAYTEKNEVWHIHINGIEELAKLRKSKYVQSRLGEAYKDVQEFLQEGKRVVFSGTPCQIAGLYSVLGKDYENLYTLDLICTGVTSPLLLSKNMSMLEKKYKGSIRGVDMRYKVQTKDGWNIGDTEIVFEDGRRLRNKDTRLYRHVYGQKLAYRDSCYHCRYAKSSRGADITIGDWWGNIGQLSDIKEHKGISLMLFNSKKGKELIPVLKEKMYMSEMDFELAQKDNPTLNSPTKKEVRYERFWHDFDRIRDERLFKKYAKPEMKTYIPWLLSRVIPAAARKRIKRLIHR